MVRVFLQGGLGNQMFQYAAARAVAARHQTDLCVDLSWYHFPVKRRYQLPGWGLRPSARDSRLSFACNLLLKKPLFELRGSQPVFRERSYDYDPAVFDLGGDCALIGNFQNEQYFSAVAEELRRDFALVAGREPAEVTRWRDAIARARHPVAVHVRRGDYLRYPMFQVCTRAYYQRALDHLHNALGDCDVFFFSDEPAWCRETFPADGHHFVECPGSVQDPVGDLRLMAACHHHVLSNSSFSWWGAWLARCPAQIVLVPDLWIATRPDVTSIAPSSWIRIPHGESA